MGHLVHSHIRSNALVALLLAFLLLVTPAAFAQAAETDALEEQSVDIALASPALPDEAAILGEGQQAEQPASQAVTIDDPESHAAMPAGPIADPSQPEGSQPVAKAQAELLGADNETPTGQPTTPGNAKSAVESPEDQPSATNRAELEGAESTTQAGTLAQTSTANSLTQATPADTSNKAPATAIADLTPLQWGSSDETTAHAVGAEGTADSSLHIPGFGATGSNMDRPITVAVFDGLVDHTHPDLTKVIYEFSEAEQQLLGCGRWGYNAAYPYNQDDDSFTAGDHATHCAGIIGASWDGSGISGVGSNVRIVSVRVLNNDDDLVYESVLRGFAFVDAFNETHDSADWIRVISMSLGLASSSRALYAAVTDLGQKYGTVTVMSAGNASTDKDIYLDMASSLVHNPFAIVVLATNGSGDPSVFTDFGTRTVNIGAPGTAILSTVPAEEGFYIADADSNNIFYEGFEAPSSTPGGQADYLVTVEQIAAEDGQVGQDAPSAITNANGPRFAGSCGVVKQIDPSLSHTSEGTIRSIFKASMTLTDEQVARIRQALDDGEEPQLGFAFSSVGNKVMCGRVEFGKDAAGNDVVEWTNGTATTSTGGWSVAAVNLSDQILQMLTPGNVTGTQTLTFAITLITGVADYVAFDSFGIGTLKAPYDIWDGTSMACPYVAGAVAVLAAAYPDEGADQLVARILDSASHRDSLDGLVTSGGILDLAQAMVTEGTAKATEDPQAPWPLYETDLPLDTSTGDAYRWDAPGDLQTYGPMVALDGALYYLGALLATDADFEGLGGFAYRMMQVFDIASSTWWQSIELPLPLVNLSACAYDGKLWLLGIEAAFENGTLLVDSTKQAHVLSYDPTAGTWQEHATDGLFSIESCALYATDQGLEVFCGGGRSADGTRWRATSFPYDPIAGLTLTAIRGFDQLGVAISRFSMAAHGSDVYVYSSNANAIYHSDGSQVSEGRVELPAGYGGKTRGSGTNSLHKPGYDYNQLLPNPCVLVAGDEALYIVGYLDADQQADTWVLPYGSFGDAELQPYGKHISTTKPLMATSAFYDGILYALAADWAEHDERVFRATRVEGTEPEPAPEPDPEPGILPDAEPEQEREPETTPAPSVEPALIPAAGTSPEAQIQSVAHTTPAGGVSDGAPQSGRHALPQTSDACVAYVQMLVATAVIAAALLLICLAIFLMLSPKKPNAPTSGLLG